MAASRLSSLLILLALSVSPTLFALAQEETNQFSYNGFRGANLRINGIANIHPNGLLQLTNTSKQQIGHAFFPSPLHFNTSSSNNNSSPPPFSFSTTFVFAMVPETPMRGGHGIAFAISPSLEFTGVIATQYLGLFNSTTIGLSSNHLFAMELDVVRNPEFNDINDDHVGVDINNLTSIQSAPAAYFSEHEGRNESLELISGKPMQVWIDYDHPKKQLNVTLAPTGILKPVQPLLTTSVDLSSVLLDSMYVGFSSSTGSVASNHYILGWSFNRSGIAQSLHTSQLPSLPAPRTSKTKLELRIMIPLLSVGALLVAISATVFVIRKRYEEVREDWEQQYGPQRFTYKDLYKATKGFKDKELLGSGGFGRVYKGVIRSSNQQVAVKKVSHDSKQGMKEFVAEIASMGRLRHRNLVQLLGTGRATTSSDVFAFGTFMLEVACGRKPVELEKSNEQLVLVDWVSGCWKRGVILETADHRLGGGYVEQEMELVLMLGLLCTQRIPEARPSMRQIVQYLDGNASLPQIPLHGEGVDLISTSNGPSRDHSLQVMMSTSKDISSFSFSDCDSILSTGR
ncbi:hypothetical protein Tsubulata_043345 [Turnera subulata]|uniref:Protein kinase domain-containing protein n=1 Tax=Turnera subulata TaxID=218843 RepID=A0A9Q0FLQ1_9ROSI|nr:hypothetical protein Tsubulata_043345 [Turnera subulata]